jgi:hypothetical protein
MKVVVIMNADKNRTTERFQINGTRLAKCTSKRLSALHGPFACAHTCNDN